MTAPTLPSTVAAALADPSPGERIMVQAAGIPWSALAFGYPTARPLLLIHGVTSSAANWWRLGPALAASGRRAVAVDLPGHGHTGHWLGHHRFRDNAADVTGQTFIVGGSGVWRMQPFNHLASLELTGKRLTVAEISARRGELFGDDDPGLPPFQAPKFG